MKTRHFLQTLCLVAAWLLIANPATSRGNKTLDWTPAYSMKFKRIFGVALSPDGSRIAYVVREPLMQGEKSEYLSHIWMATADGDFDDIMNGVDKAIDMGVVHPDSLCLMGWSYGGYMTSFAVTRTHRFKAASMGAGLPDLISMVTTTGGATRRKFAAYFCQATSARFFSGGLFIR